MPLFSWMKWPRAEEERAQVDRMSLAPGATSSRLLIRELLCHLEEKERLSRELEQEHRLAHSALGLRWLQNYPRLQTLIPPSERLQLESLCAQIQPVHTAVVLSRFREVLATNNVLPWELVYVFKQVLHDFLNQEEGEEEAEHWPQPGVRKQMESWTSRYHMKQGFVTPTVPNCSEPPREEIPTISGYVDRAMMRASAPFTHQRSWNFAYYYPVPVKSSDAYSTTL